MMAIEAEMVTVGETAVEISSSESDTVSGQILYISNVTSGDGVTITIGASDVVAGQGFIFSTGSLSWPVVLGEGERLYAVCGTGESGSLAVLRTGV